MRVIRIFRYLRPHARLAAVSVAVTVLTTGAGLLAPWPLKLLIDSVLGEHAPPALVTSVVGGERGSLLVFAILAGLGVAVADNALHVLGSFVNTRVEQAMALDFRSDLFQHAQRLSLAYHDQRRAGMVIYAINFHAAAAASIIMAVQLLARSVLTLVGMLWISFHIDWQLALLSLIVVPVLYQSVRYYMRHVETRLVQVKGLEGESLSIIHEAMSMMRVIVAFGRESYEYRRFRDQGERAVDARVDLTVRQTLFSLVVNVTTAVGTALVLGLGAYHVLHGQLSIGQLLVVMSYIAAVYQPLQTISTSMSSLQDRVVSLRMAFDLLDTEPEIRDAPGAVAVGRARGRVTFEGVHFHYRDRESTLTDVSFEAEPGRVVAIVGPTGAGKTTLVSLIPRFYDPDRGRVLLDGVDIRGLSLRSLREQISIVLQEPLLFSGTIADNIRYGRLEASAVEIEEAARAANAHDFIVARPQKYETVLGERGVLLSGGERQRVAVARAFLKNAPLLILDEPTSSIDSRTEAVILEALERLMVGRTTFLVAHRLSTIRAADMVLVLDRGQLVEQGTPDELIARNGLFRQLHDIQTARARARSARYAEAAER